MQAYPCMVKLDKYKTFVSYLLLFLPAEPKTISFLVRLLSSLVLFSRLVRRKFSKVIALSKLSIAEFILLMQVVTCSKPFAVVESMFISPVWCLMPGFIYDKYRGLFSQTSHPFNNLPDSRRL